MLNSRSKARQQVLTTDPVARVVKAFAKARGGFAPWFGTATELLADLRNFDVEAELPPAANTLSGRLTELAPALREEGVIIAKSTVGHSSKRILMVHYRRSSADDADASPFDPREEEKKRRRLCAE